MWPSGVSESSSVLGVFGVQYNVHTLNSNLKSTFCHLPMEEHQPAFTTEHLLGGEMIVALAWNRIDRFHRGDLPQSKPGVLSCDSLLQVLHTGSSLFVNSSLPPSLPMHLSANFLSLPLPLSFQANSCVERAVLLQLQSYFQTRLAAYPTTIAEDDAIVSGRGLGRSGVRNVGGGRSELERGCEWRRDTGWVRFPSERQRS